MPSKIKKAIGVVKDHTSISLAKVSSINSSNLEVAVLRCTTHDEVPVDDRYVNEVLLLTSSNKFYAAVCAQAIAKRIGRTRNWIVTLKSLTLVLRLFQDGDPYFAREVLHAMKRGSKIVNLSSFRDDSNSSPWDYTAFIRTFALYLDERLNCFLKGKLQRRVSLKEDTKHDGRRSNEPVRDMKPAMLLDRIFHWQRLLERAIATQPTGAAKANRLVQISVYAIVRESFDLYRDISDGLALLLDSFFHLQYQSCVDAFHACVKASKQFEELCKFYTLCKSIGVGRMSEYPSVRTISEELIETLQEFLKDQSSFPSNKHGSISGPPAPHQLLLPAPDQDGSTSPNRSEASEQPERLSAGTSLEDLMSVTDAGTGSTLSNADKERSMEPLPQQQSVLDDLIDVNTPRTSASASLDEEQNLEQFHRGLSLSPLHDLISANFAGEASSSDQLVHQRNSSVLDLGLLFDDQAQYEEQRPSVSGSDGGREGWELVLAESASDAPTTPSISFEPSFLDSLYNQASNYVNPFLNGGEIELSAATPAIAASPATFSPFQASPTFRAQNPDETTTGSEMGTDDPFTPCNLISATQASMEGSMSQHQLHEQQLWLQHQSKIMAKLQSM